MQRRKKILSLPEDLLADLDDLRGERTVADVAVEAVCNWVRQERRRRDDKLIVRAAGQRSPDRVIEEGSNLREAADSVQRVLKRLRRR